MALRIAVGQFKEVTPQILSFAAQLGATGVQMNNPTLPGEHRWERDAVAHLVTQVEAAGLALEAIENVPVHFYDKVMLGLPGRDEQIANYIATMRAVRAAGVPILGYHFMPNSVWRTDRSAPGRGGAGNTAFDMALVPKDGSRKDFERFVPTQLGHQAAMPLLGPGDEPYDEARMQANYDYFMDAVLPVADEIGLRLALHPDDPPVEMLGGVARIFRSPAHFRRAWERHGTHPSWALDLCLGSCSEMAGGAGDVREMIDFFGPKGVIAYVHFRDVIGTVPAFRECFIGEGNFDPAEIMRLLMEVGFDGFILDDHVPQMIEDTGYGHRGRAHAVGYLQGLVTMARHLGQSEAGTRSAAG